MFRLALEVAPYPMIVVRGDGTMVMVNQAAERLFGYEAQELIGQPVELLVPSGKKLGHRQHRADFGEDPKARLMGTRRNLQAVTRSGTEIPTEIGLSPVNTSAGLMVICAILDLSAQTRIEEDLAEMGKRLAGKNEKLLELVATDSLTALKSRQAFLEQLTAQLETSVRHARPLSILILDIDYFKPYNDDFGHLAGDEVLKQTGRILREVARRSDFVARIGGEEFGIILPETDRRGAIVLGERFREAIQTNDWPRRPITASIGATTVDFEASVPRPDPPELSLVLTEADRALYRSKDRGRNRVTHVAEMDGDG